MLGEELSKGYRGSWQWMVGQQTAIVAVFAVDWVQWSPEVPVCVWPCLGWPCLRVAIEMLQRSARLNA